MGDRKPAAGKGASRPGEGIDEGASRVPAKSAAARHARPGKAGAEPGTARGRKVVLLSGGNPRIAKADGDAPVQAWIAACPGWKSGVGRRLDMLVVRTVPGVRKAVRWNSPLYGVEGRGWFLGVHAFTRFVKVTFFRGASLRPLPPGGTARSGESRWIDLREGEFDEGRLEAWVKQAAALPGWIP